MIDTIYTPTHGDDGFLELWPLTKRMTAETDVDVWSKHTPKTVEEKEFWTIRVVGVRMFYPGYKFTALRHYGWRSYENGVIEAYRGFSWNGASGPAVDDPAAVLGSLTHDIICEKVQDCETGKFTYVVPNYFTRHWMYAATLKAQGEPTPRVMWSFAGLILGNWALILKKRAD